MLSALGRNLLLNQHGTATWLRCSQKLIATRYITRRHSSQLRQFNFSENDYIFSHLPPCHRPYREPIVMSDSLQRLIQVVTQTLQYLDEKHPAMWSEGTQESLHKLPKSEYTLLRHTIDHYRNDLDYLFHLLITINRGNERNLNVALINTIISDRLAKILGTSVAERDTSLDLDLLFHIFKVLYLSRMRHPILEHFVDYLTHVRFRDLTDNQLHHALFHLTLMRTNKKDYLSILEPRIIKMIQSADIDELANISLAYFKTNTRVKNRRMPSLLMDRLINLLPRVDPSVPSFSAILKVLSLSVLDLQDLKKLKEKLCESNHLEILFSNHHNIVQIVRLFRVHPLLFDESLLNTIAQYTVDKLDCFRIKDLAIVTSAFDVVYYKHEKFSEILDHVAYKMDKEKLKEFSTSFISILKVMAHLGIWHEGMVNLFNDKDFQEAVISQDVLSKKPRTFNDVMQIYTTFKVDERFAENHSVKFDFPLEHLKRLEPTDREDLSPWLKSENGIERLRSLLADPLMIENKRRILFARRLVEHLPSQCKISYQNIFYEMPNGYLIVSENSVSTRPFDTETLLPQRVPLNIGSVHNPLVLYLLFGPQNHSLRGSERFYYSILKQLGYKVMLILVTCDDRLSLQPDSYGTLADKIVQELSRSVTRHYDAGEFRISSIIQLPAMKN